MPHAQAPRPPAPGRPPDVTAGKPRAYARAALGVAALVGIALLAMVLGPHRIGDYFTESDFYGAYADGARLIQHGRLDPGRYGVVGPVYEMVLALVALVGRDFFRSAQLISVAATVGTLLIWYRLLKRRASPGLALLAMLFMATNPVLFLFGYSATTDALALALQAGSLALLIGGTGRGAALGSGVLAALAFLTRYNAIYLLPTGLVTLLAGGAPGEPGTARGRALRFTAGFALLVTAWVVYSLAHGVIPASRLHHNVAYEVFARGHGISWDEYESRLEPQFHSLRDVIARDPGAVARHLLFNLFAHLREDASTLLGWPLACAALAGLALVAARRAGAGLWPVWLAGGLAYLTLVPVFHSERYGLPLLPAYATLAAAAFAWGGAPRGRRAGVSRVFKPALAAVVLGLSLAASVRTQVESVRKLPTDVLDCAPTLRRLSRPGDRVIARKSQIAWYGGVDPVPFPLTDSLATLADYARRTGARWLYASWVEAELRPRFWYLLDTTAAVPGLTARQQSRVHPAFLYEIGPEFGQPPDWMRSDTLAWLHRQRGRLRVATRNASLLYEVAQTEARLGQLAEARAHLERAVEVSPSNPDALLALGGVALSQGDAAAARSAFERALAVAPASLEARVGLGWASLTAGNADEAARIWRPLVGSVADLATLDRMARLFAAVGDREAAEQALARLKVATERR